MSLFGKKKPKGMDEKQLRALDKKPLKYVTEREAGTYREIRIGGEGGINIKGGELLVVCGGVNAIRCALGEVSAGELMDRSGIVIKGPDLDTGRIRSIVAHYSDGAVGLANAKKR